MSQTDPTEGEVKACPSLAHLLPETLIRQLAFKVFGREATPRDLSDLLSPLAAPPRGLERLGQGSPTAPGRPLVSPSHDWVRVSLSGSQSLSGYSARPLGLAVSYGIYQSSRWESGGWDGYNIDVVSLVFLAMLRCSPKPGSDRPFERNLALLGHYHFDGSLNQQKTGQPLRASSRESLLAGVATTPEELSMLALSMDIDGYGPRACRSLLEKAPLTFEELSDLLSPSYCEREALEEQILHAPRSAKRGM